MGPPALEALARGSMIGNVAVAAIAGGITGTQAAVVVLIALALLVTLARRKS